MTSQVIRLYRCDQPGCAATSLGRDAAWWIGHKATYCPLHNAPPCAICERPMRLQRFSLAEKPGTVKYASNGTCASCVNGASRLDNLSQEKVWFVRRLVNSRVKDTNARNDILDALGI